MRMTASFAIVSADQILDALQTKGKTSLRGAATSIFRGCTWWWLKLALALVAAAPGDRQGAQALYDEFFERHPRNEFWSMLADNWMGNREAANRRPHGPPSLTKQTNGATENV